MGGVPVLILKEGTRRERGKEAQKNNIAAARAVADAVRTTLGPRGMDKMLVDTLGDITITNDGATILKTIDIVHPAAKMMVEVAKAQDQEVGDGTTTAVVLAGELLKYAEELIDSNVHPTIIIKGYRMAVEKAIESLKQEGFAIKVNPDDEETLKKIAITAMTGKNVGGAKEHLADIAVKAVKYVAREVDGKLKVDVDDIKIVKKHGGGVTDTEIINGIIIDKEKVHPRMPTIVRNAKIALINAPLEIKKTEFDAKIQIRSPEQIKAFIEQEEKELKKMVDRIREVGANVVFCQKGIDDVAQHFMAKYGIYAVRRVKKSDMEKLSKATGARIVTSLDDLSPEDLGEAELVEERKVADEKMTFVLGCKNPKSVTILVRGGTEHVVDEVERSIHDALRVVGVTLEDGLAVPGGGAPEIEASLALLKYAPKVGGKEQIAIEAFARALESIPKALAENAGLDPIKILIELRKAHEEGKKTYGIDVVEGKIRDMLEINVIEPFRVKKHAFESAREVATMVLRIDDVINAKGEEKKEEKEKEKPETPKFPEF